MNKYILKRNSKKLPEDKHILIIFRLEFTQNDFRTLGKLQKFNKEDINYYIKYLEHFLEIKTDTYIQTPINSIIISSGIREGKIISNHLVNLDTLQSNNKINAQSFYNNKLPVSFNPLDYGKLIKQNDIITQEGKRISYIIALTDKSIVIIDQFISPSKDGEVDKFNLVKYYKNNKLILEWKDTWINDKMFIRKLGKSFYTFEKKEGEVAYELVLHRIFKATGSILKNKSSSS